MTTLYNTLNIARLQVVIVSGGANLRFNVKSTDFYAFKSPTECKKTNYSGFL